MASSWQLAWIRLLQKSDDTSHPSKMRPISILNVEGRIYFTIVNKRLAKFLLSNNYLDTRIQKGFIEAIAGCIEFGALMQESMKYAKVFRRSICISWLDLANAFGSVSHALVQFALAWFHVPYCLRKLLHCYYESVFSFVEGCGWASDWFWVSVGVLQGCTVSPTLFD